MKTYPIEKFFADLKLFTEQFNKAVADNENRRKQDEKAKSSQKKQSEEKASGSGVVGNGSKSTRSRKHSSTEERFDLKDLDENVKILDVIRLQAAIAREAKQRATARPQGGGGDSPSAHVQRQARRHLNRSKSRERVLSEMEPN